MLDYYVALAAQNQATRSAVEELAPEALAFEYDAMGGQESYFCGYAPDKLSNEALAYLAGLEALPSNGCEPEKGYDHVLVFRVAGEPSRRVVVYDRYGSWRWSGDAETLAAFELWAATRL